MTLTRNELINRIAGMHLDDLDMVITAAGSEFTVTDSRTGPYVSDIGSSYEVPDVADEHGRVCFAAGPWDAFQYHASYSAPRRDNYEPMIDDLEEGLIQKIILGCGAVDNTWVFGIRCE